MCRTTAIRMSMQVTEAAIRGKLQYIASLIINDNELNAEATLHHTNRP